MTIDSWLDRHRSQIKEVKFSLLLVKRIPLILVGLITLGILLGLAVFAPHLTRYDPTDMQFSQRLEAPSTQHLLGTDDNGMDIFSRILFGIRLDLLIAIVVVAVVAVWGTLLGVFSGYHGGKLDELCMRTADIFMAFPYLLLAMAIAAVLGPGISHSIIAISITWWPVYARLARGATLAVKERPFVEASRAMGAKNHYIIFRHILPNIIAPIVVQATLDMGNVILGAAALSFIGLGAQAPQPELGLMIGIGRNFMRDYWWVATFPGLTILIMVLGFNLLGDGLRDLLDPRQRRSLV
jgi:peptide/nickel transport system permease protein